METTCRLYKTPINRRVILGKRVTEYATMLWERASWWMNRWQLTFQQVIIVRTSWQKYFTEGNWGITWGTYYTIYMMIKSWNITYRYHTLKDDCECYHTGQHFTLEGIEKVWSYFYGRKPMLCRLDLVSTEKITHCEMTVIWTRRNTAEIRSTEGCRVEIQSA